MSLLVGLGAACGERSDPPEPSDPDPIARVRDDDRAMNTAIAEARAHLDVFDRALSAAEPGRVFTVKKAFPTRDGREHIWVTDVKPAAGGFRGRIDSDPRDVAGIHYGDEHFVARSEVTDWLISDEQGRIWGGYTMRVLLSSMPPEIRRAREAAFQPLPE